MNWINVKDRLPEDQCARLAICFDDISEYEHPFTPSDAMHIAFFSSGCWWLEEWPYDSSQDNCVSDVTHWMPLPEPPKG